MYRYKGGLAIILSNSRIIWFKLLVRCLLNIISKLKKNNNPYPKA